jgi:hypothetical protein
MPVLEENLMPHELKLYDLMKAAGITNGQLAAESGVWHSTLSLALVRGLKLSDEQERAVRDALYNLAQVRLQGAERILREVGDAASVYDLKRQRELTATTEATS